MAGMAGARIAMIPIGVLPLIYRLWARARYSRDKHVIRAQEDETEWGGPGKGAIDGLWADALRAEPVRLARATACPEQDTVAAFHLDLSKCFDTVALLPLIDDCREGGHGWDKDDSKSLIRIPPSHGFLQSDCKACAIRI